MSSAVLDPATAPLEELFLLLFCTLDDLYPSIAPPELARRPGAHRLAMSDSEILTLSLMQEALSMDSELAFHRFVKRNYTGLFPRLVSRDRYHRRRKALLYLHQACFDHFARLAEQQARFLVVDSAPVETVAFVRSQSGQASIPGASYGFAPSKKRHFFGLRLHALATDRGSVAAFTLTAANAGERAVARDMLAERSGSRVLGDSGYAGEEMQAWCRDRDIDLHASKKPTQAKMHERAGQSALKGLRLIVETVFGMLSDQFRIETTRARSAWGVSVRVVAKIAALNVSAWLNEQYGRSPLAVKSLYS